MTATKTLIGLFAAAAVVALLASCSSPRNYAQEEHQACESVGAYWGTPEYINCRGILYQARVNQGIAQRQAYMQWWGTTMNNMNNTRSTSCYYSGNTVTCN